MINDSIGEFKTVKDKVYWDGILAYNKRPNQHHNKKYLKEECELCGEKEPLEIHHVIPVGTTEVAIDDEWNLKTLCSNCHKITHNKMNKRLILIPYPTLEPVIECYNKGLGTINNIIKLQQKLEQTLKTIGESLWNQTKQLYKKQTTD